MSLPVQGKGLHNKTEPIRTHERYQTPPTVLIKFTEFYWSGEVTLTSKMVQKHNLLYKTHLIIAHNHIWVIFMKKIWEIYRGNWDCAFSSSPDMAQKWKTARLKNWALGFIKLEWKADCGLRFYYSSPAEAFHGLKVTLFFTKRCNVFWRKATGYTMAVTHLLQEFTLKKKKTCSMILDHQNTKAT